MIDFIVSVFNGASSIRDCLLSINALDSSKNIFVVDDHSTDETAEIINNLAKEIELTRIARNDPRRSKARAVNQAYDQGGGEIVCVVDADVIFKSDRFGVLTPLLMHFDCLALTDCREDDDVKQVTFNMNFVVPRNCFMIRRSASHPCLLDRSYPDCGGEDLDLIIRLLKAQCQVGSTYGGYEHLRQGLRMGVRRRIHFHYWNIRTYIKHFDTAFAKKRLAAIGIAPLRHVLASARQEWSKQPCTVTKGSAHPHEDQ